MIYALLAGQAAVQNDNVMLYTYQAGEHDKARRAPADRQGREARSSSQNGTCGPISLKSSACQCLISTGPAPGDALLRKFPRDGKFHSFMCGSWRLEAIWVFILREQQTDGSEASAPRASTVRRDV